MDEQLKGIGGWLNLVHIGLYVSLLFSLYALISMALYGTRTPFNFLYVLLGLFLLFLSASLLANFYHKNRNFSNLTILWMGVALFTGVLGIKLTFGFVIFYLVLFILTTTYLKKSKRVKNTFVN